MDVHIDRVRFDIQVKEVRRRHSIRDEMLVSFHHGLVEIRTAEITAVDEEVLVAQTLLGHIRTADEAGHIDHICRSVDVDEFIGHIASEQIQNPEFQGFGWLEVVNVLAVVLEMEAGLRTGQSHMDEFCDDVFEFDIV